jgi:hypothetical protein
MLQLVITYKWLFINFLDIYSYDKLSIFWDIIIQLSDINHNIRSFRPVYTESFRPGLSLNSV